MTSELEKFDDRVNLSLEMTFDDMVITFKRDGTFAEHYKCNDGRMYTHKYMKPDFDVEYLWKESTCTLDEIRLNALRRKYLNEKFPADKPLDHKTSFVGRRPTVSCYLSKTEKACGLCEKCLKLNGRL